MASTPPIPDGDAAAAPLAGTVQVAAGLHARRTPLLSTPRGRGLAGIGDLARSVRRFSSLTFLSLSARRTMEARYRGTDTGLLSVRPPDYWSGHHDDELGAPRVSTGDAAFDRLVARRAAQKREAEGRNPSRRGLPSTIHRRSHSLAGPLTAPGGMARRLLPASVVPAPNPANSPQTAAGREPRSARASRPARRDGEPARPAPRPTPPAAAAASVARTGADGSDAVRRGPAPPTATGQPTSPSEWAPAGPVSSSSATLAASQVGTDATGPDVVAAEPHAPTDASWPEATDPAVTWPGVERERASSSPTTVGRQVAVRPLLAGWRAPTAWRSIAAGPGVRLLPVGPQTLSSAGWSDQAAPAASWADTVRRAAIAADASPEAVRRLPVGGPAFIVRDGSPSGDAPSGAGASSGRTASTGPAVPGHLSGPSPATTTRSARPGVGDVAARRSQAAPTSRAASRSTSAPATSLGSVASDSSRSVTSWSSLAGAAPILVRRRTVSSPDGPGVEVSTWTLPPGAATVRRAAPPGTLEGATGGPGFRPSDARGPGRWLARAAGASGSGVVGGVHRVPVGPLGPVRWSARADEPVVARSAAPGSAWSASVAAASAAMAGGSPLAASTGVRPPGSGGLTLVRGGAVGGGDLPVASVQRAGNHPAANRLRLVPSSPVAEPGSMAPSIRRAVGDPAGVSPRTASETAFVGRAPMGAAPFVSVPGAVAAHGLPSAAAPLVGVTVTGPGAGRPATPGLLARLVHGQPVLRRTALQVAPPALVRVDRAPEVAQPPVRHLTRPGLPAGPAGLARRQAAVAHQSVTATGLSPVALGSGAMLRRRSDGSPIHVDRLMTPGARRPSERSGIILGGPVASVTSGPQSWAQRVAAFAGSEGAPTVASLRGLPVAPAAFALRDVDGSGAASPSSVHKSGAVHRSRTPHGVAATVAQRVRGRRDPVPAVAARWRATDVPARSLPGLAPAALRPLTSSAPASRAEIRRRPLRPSSPGAAARFDEVLRSTAPVRPVALPVRFRPLAERIVGRMPVQIATGAASRRALASVGASAATTSSVIHLPSAPDSSARTASILAHELTHVAAASPVARFHGGRPSIEETAATQVERIVARAARTNGQGRGPATSGTSGLPVGGFVGVRGATARPPVPDSVGGSAGGISATAAAAIVSRSASSGGEIQRRADGISGGSSSRSGSSGTVQRSSAAGGGARTADATDRTIRRFAETNLERGAGTSDDTLVLSEQAMDTIVQALEARLLESIERRGGLWRGGF